MNKHDSKIAKEEMYFDHGLPFLHMATSSGKQDVRYMKRVERWRELGFLEVWEGRFGCLRDGEYLARSADMQEMSNYLRIFGALAGIGARVAFVVVVVVVVDDDDDEHQIQH